MRATPAVTPDVGGLVRAPSPPTRPRPRDLGLLGRDDVHDDAAAQHLCEALHPRSLCARCHTGSVPTRPEAARADLRGCVIMDVVTPSRPDAEDAGASRLMALERAPLRHPA